MISQAAATDIPIAQPIIPPNIPTVRWIKIVKIFLEYNKIQYYKLTMLKLDFGVIFLARY